LKGRAFTERDNADAPQVVIINETMAHRYWPDEEPIGKRLNIGNTCEIVGVVADVKHWGLDQMANSEMYVPYPQNARNVMSLAVRSDSDLTGLVAAVRNAVWEVDKNQPIYNVKAMEQTVSESLFPQRISMIMMTVFAGVAVI